MKLLILLIVGVIAMPTAFSQSLIILDEGHNTQQTLRVPTSLRGKQGCQSMQTQFRSNGVSTDFVSGSLCTNQSEFFDFGLNVSEHRNTRTYTKQTPATQSFNVTLFKNGRGRHGNLVSNAAYDFDRTLEHRLWQVFGIERKNGSDKWVSTNVPESQQIPGENILLALDEIGIFSDPDFSSTSKQNGLGAVVMSLGSRAGTVSNLRCGAEDGQRSVDDLYNKGIAVVVALLNEDIPSNQVSWPACLNNVIKVGGEKAVVSDGTRQIGVGANGGIDFFAKDTTNASQEGNSFAAPRVAAAYAILHKMFPFSSVAQKTEALKQADTLTDSYTTRLVDGVPITYKARKIRKHHLPNAIAYLTNLFPPKDNSSTDLNIIDTSKHGSYYNVAKADFNATFNFDRLRPQVATAKGVSLKAGTGVLSSRRDVEVKFTGVFKRGGYTRGFDLYVNNLRVESFFQFYKNTPSTRSFIINRNLLLDSGDNTISIRPRNPNSNWGLTDISIKYLPTVPLTVGVVDTNIYGYQQSPTRYTGLRMTFDVPKDSKGNYMLSATGFDIDRHDESEVFVNGHFLGNLNKGAGSTQFSSPNRFTLPSSMLREGKNYIEFVQREPQAGVWIGFENEKWAVKDVKIMTGSAGIIPIISFLLDDE